MTTHTAALLAAAVLCAGRLVESSGCFGGDPDIVPHREATGLPVNTQVRIARRAPAAVVWTGPGGASVRVREEHVGAGPARAVALVPLAPLAAGWHTITTKDPDVTTRFAVGEGADVDPPRLRGTLTLESHHAPEPGSTCPVNTWIRAAFDLPDDDRTPPQAFSYLLTLEDVRGTRGMGGEILAHAEAVEGRRVRLRVGETGCGCLPRASLDPASRYRVTIRALDAAGHRSRESLTGEVAFGSSRTPGP